MVQNQDADCIAGRIQEYSVNQAQKLNQGFWCERNEPINQSQEEAEVVGTVRKKLVSQTQEQSWIVGRGGRELENQTQDQDQIGWERKQLASQGPN